VLPFLGQVAKLANGLKLSTIEAWMNYWAVLRQENGCAPQSIKENGAQRLQMFRFVTKRFISKQGPSILLVIICIISYNVNGSLIFLIKDQNNHRKQKS
jgi:hypothetical protein